MIKSAKEINETKQNFLQSLSDAENLSKQLNECNKNVEKIEETINEIAESKINYIDDEEYIELEKRKNDINAKMHDIKCMREANFRCRQKKINAAKVTKSNVAEQRNNSSESCLFIKFLKFLFLLPSSYLVYMIIISLFHVFDPDDRMLAIVNTIVIIIMIIIYFIIYFLICGILDTVNERIKRKRKVKVTPEPIKISAIDTSEYDERIDKFNLQIVELEEEFQECKNELQSYFDEKEKDKDELLRKENERLEKAKRERDIIESALDSSIFGSEYQKYRKKVNFIKNGKRQEKGNFSRFYELIGHINPTDRDTFLFIHKNLSGKDLEFKSVRIKDSFITENESDFYKNVLSEVVRLARFIKMNYQILCSIRLIDFFECNNTDVSDDLKHSLMNKHIDFALLNLKTFQIDLLIELDDNSHFLEESLTRDFYKDLVITKKGYTLYRTDNGVPFKDNKKVIIEVLTNPKLQGQVIYNYSEEYKEKRSEKLHECVVRLDECVTNA